ncbi:MAG: type II secretion system protein GspK, partial [Pirellula sp.]
MMKPSKQPSNRRRGFLLLAVLIVISAVTLASTAFMKSMLLGHEESRITGQSIQARYAADSGIDAARLFVAYSRAARLEAGGTFNNPNTFQAIPVLQSPDPANPCNYTLIAPNLNEDGKYSGVRFGLQNESARLNLNVLPTIDAALSLPAALMGGSSNLMPIPGAS